MQYIHCLSFLFTEEATPINFLAVHADSLRFVTRKLWSIKTSIE